MGLSESSSKTHPSVGGLWQASPGAWRSPVKVVQLVGVMLNLSDLLQVDDNVVFWLK